MTISARTLMGLFTFLSGITSGLFSCSQPVSKPDNAAMKASIYEIKIKTIDGKETTLADYKGKKMLIVNVASECGYTPQYAGLQKLHEQYGDKVVVLGFPANDFGAQEPGNEEQIKTFCSKNYGVTFPMFSKITVKGNDMHPLYQWLTDPEKNGWNSQGPTWNFNKYLVNENGNLTDYFPSRVNPLDEIIISKIK